MLGLGTEHTYYYHMSAIDMRKGFNGLSGLVSEHMEAEQGQNIVYAFINKQKDKLKFELDDLRWQLEVLKRQVYGVISERFVPVDSSQLELFEEMLIKLEQELEKHTIIYQRDKKKKKSLLKLLKGLE